MNPDGLRQALLDRILSQAEGKARQTDVPGDPDRMRFFAERRTDLLLPFLIEVRSGCEEGEEITDVQIRAATARQMRFANEKFREILRTRLESESPDQQAKTRAGLDALEELLGEMNEPSFLDGDEGAISRVAEKMAVQGDRHW